MPFRGGAVAAFRTRSPFGALPDCDSPERSRPDADARVRGFTVLELLVVLLLLGLLAAVAAPNLERLYAGLTRNIERDYILRQFADLGRYARQQGQTYVIQGAGDAPENRTTGRSSEPPAPEGSPASASGDWSAEAGAPSYPIDLPEGWEIQLDRPLVVRASGACLGALLTLVYRTEIEGEFTLKPPYCTVVDDA